MKRREATLLITFEDLVRVAKKNREILRRIVLIGAIVGLLFALCRPLVFRAQGSFQTGATQSSAINFAQVLSTNFYEREDSTQVLMRSETVLRKVVEKLGLQVHVNGYSPPGVARDFFRNGLYTLTGWVLEFEKFVISDVHFDGRKEKKMVLVLKENQECYFFDERKQLLAKGRVGQPVEGVDFCLTLSSLPSDIRMESPYYITLVPWCQEVVALKKHFEIRPDKQDRQVLWLYFLHNDAELAAKMINQITESFITHLNEEEEKLSASQITHLDERRKRLEEEFEEALSLHVDALKKNVDETGFVEVRQQLELFQKPLLTLHDEMVKLGVLESSLKEVQATYAKAVGIPFSNPENMVASTEDMALLLWPQQFAGIDLPTARELHSNYQKQLDDVEEHVDRIDCLLPKVQGEGFELHSVGLLAGDEVASSLVNEASKLAISLERIGDYSQKDQQRMNDSLKSQRHFIEIHLKQTSELYRKQALLLQSKLASLRAVMLHLIEKEKVSVQEQLRRFQTQLARIPEKWKLEKILEAKGTMMKKVVESVSQIIENRIVEHHLKIMGNKVIDPARIPDAPFRTHPLMISLLSSLFCFLGAYVLFFTRDLWRGFPLSLSSAKVYGLQVAGILSDCNRPVFEELPKCDLETSRKVVRFIEEKRRFEQATCTAVVGRCQKGWSESLARLLALQNHKILVVDLSFSACVSTEQRGGLLAYLHGEVSDWTTLSSQGYDLLPSGGTTGHAAELFQSERFDQFLDIVRQKYDHILLLSETPLVVSETLYLIKKCDLCAAVVDEESYDDLQQSELTEQKKIIYLWIEKYA